MDGKNTEEYRKSADKIVRAMGRSAALERMPRGSWKLDFNVGAESVFLSLSMLFLIFALMALGGHVCLLLKKETVMPWWTFLVPLSVSLFFYLLKKTRDDHYIIDLPTGRLLLSRGFFGMRQGRTVVPLDEIFAVAMQGTLLRGKGGRVWLYHLAAVLKKGVFLPMGDDFLEAFYETNEELGRELAGVLKVPYIETPRETRLDACGPVRDEGDIRRLGAKDLDRRLLRTVVMISVGIAAALTAGVFLWEFFFG